MALISFENCLKTTIMHVFGWGDMMGSDILHGPSVLMTSLCQHSFSAGFFGK